MIFRIVPQAQIGYREFLGRGRTKLEPGIRLSIPFFHKTAIVDMREQKLRLSPNAHAFTKDNIPVRLASAVFIRVTDAEKAVYGVDDITKSVESVAESCNRATIGRFTYDEVICKRSALTEEMKRVIGGSIEAWGVECCKLEITSFAPQNEAVAAQLERQMKAERARRENELDTLAAVNTAQGRLETEKLKSAAALIAENQKTDAAVYAINEQTRAECDRIALVAATLGSTAGGVNFLLEKERLANLRTLAGNKAKTVYFFGRENALPTASMLKFLD